MYMSASSSSIMALVGGGGRDGEGGACRGALCVPLLLY